MIRALEELSMNAWPALQTQLRDGWVLRFANGYTRRANSINPLYPSSQASDSPAGKPLATATEPIGEKIASCEEIYRARKLRVVFKMTRAVFPEDLDEILARRGYQAEAETSVQVLDLRAALPPTHWDVLARATLTDEWVAHYCRLNAVAEAHHATMWEMLGNITPAHCFLELRD